MLEVYERVWVMQNNQPINKIIFAVVESMGYYKGRDDKDIYYHLVDECCGAGWGNNEGVRFNADSVFRTKKELIDKLIN